MYMLCKLEWVGLVALTAAPFSFEMDVVPVGVALLHFLTPSDFHVRARGNVYVSVYLSGRFAYLCKCSEL